MSQPATSIHTLEDCISVVTQQSLDRHTGRRMSRRRKTLSHAEIDDFLSDISISTENTVDNAKAIGSSAKYAILGNDENVPNFDSSVGSQFTNTEKVLSTSANNFGTEWSVSVPKTQAPEDYIREYCKLCYKKNATNNKTKLCELGKAVLEKTKYRLLPSRYTHPELYPHPSSSIESKRALLLSLSPMLTDGENQRNKDVKACMDYTRCVVEKSRKRNASYEYLDIDANDKIDYNEYERRYLLFVNRKGDVMCTNENYKDHDQLIEAASPAGPAEEQHICETEEAPLLCVAEDAMTEDEQEPCPTKEKAQKRRATLSPASARQMMLKAVDEEAFEEEKSEEEVVSPFIQAAAHVAQPVTATDDDLLVAQLGVELDAMFADEDDGGAENGLLSLKASENATKTITSEVAEEEDKASDEPACSEEVTEHTPVMHPNFEAVDADLIDVPEEPQASVEEDRVESNEDFEARAFMRLFVRFEQARWKYQWEICAHELKQRMSAIN